MKSKITVLLVFAFVLTINAAVSAAQPEKRAFINGLRPMSMGGAFIAVADDENAFFYNPAAITGRNGYSIQVLSIDAVLLTDTLDLYKFYKDNRKDITKWSRLTQQQQTELMNRVLNNALDKPAGVLISAPSVTFINKPIAIKENYLNFGGGLFSWIETVAKFKRGALFPCLYYNAQITGIGIIPLAYKITSLDAVKLHGTLSLGVNFKYMYRGKNCQVRVSLDEIQNYDFLNAFLEGTAFGMDFGAIYHLNTCWNFGLNVADIFTTCVKYKNVYKDSRDYGQRLNESIKLNLGVGLAYFPGKFYYWTDKYLNTNNNLMLVFDITDLTGTEERFIESPFKKIHFGAECKLSPFVIRMGFNSGYPTVGLGVVTKIVNLEYAFYGEEQGNYAGQKPSWIHRMQLSVKFGNNDKSKK
ncbi:MAG: conjugal transfer protein TraF [Endomicrobium sp.]|nr:conjugal transfer protein TraF [Endomicrobium sp.]